MVSPIQRPKSWKSFIEKAKIRLDAKTPKSMRLTFARMGIFAGGISASINLFRFSNEPVMAEL